MTPSTTADATPYPTLSPDAASGAYAIFLSGTVYRINSSGSSFDLTRWKRNSVRRSQPTRQHPGPQVHARHILLDSPEKAEEVRQRLLNGEDFAELARQESKDPGSKDKGGDLGWFGSGVMNLPFELAAFSQEVGAIGEIVESSNGQHIIQVLEKSDDRPFDADTLQRKSQDTWRNWISTAQVQPDVNNMLSADQREWALKALGGIQAGVAGIECVVAVSRGMTPTQPSPLRQGWSGFSVIESRSLSCRSGEGWGGVGSTGPSARDLDPQTLTRIAFP